MVAAFDREDRFAPFVSERVQHDPGFRKALEAMPPEEYAQVMRATISALFDGPYPTLGMSVERLKGIRTPTLVIPGDNAIRHCQVVEAETRIRRAAAPLRSYLLSRRPAPYP